MKADKTRIGVLTGGGDCPGLNAVIRGVTKALLQQEDIEVYGVEDGFLGLIENRMRSLEWNDVSDILTRGGTILGTSNSANPFFHAVADHNGKVSKVDISDLTIQNINSRGLDALVCIGGDGTMTIAHKLSKKGIKVVGVPKTIDNDIYGTDVTFGYNSALATAADAIDKIHTTAESHHRVMIVEVMGRYAGWLALGAGLAAGGDVILIPELPYDLNVIEEFVLRRSQKGKRFSIIVIAEGARPRGENVVVQQFVKKSPDPIRLGGISNKLGRDLENKNQLETRVTVLGHIQRGGTPTAFDRILSTRFGIAAAELVVKRIFNKMVALNGNEIVTIPLADVSGKCRLVPLDSHLIHAALKVGTCMGVSRI